ncbi:hypothetical protein PMIN03_011491 [Paraphaeosphaeria minitans]
MSPPAAARADTFMRDERQLSVEAASIRCQIEEQPSVEIRTDVAGSKGRFAGGETQRVARGKAWGVSTTTSIVPGRIYCKRVGNTCCGRMNSGQGPLGWSIRRRCRCLCGQATGPTASANRPGAISVSWRLGVHRRCWSQGVRYQRRTIMIRRLRHAVTGKTDLRYRYWFTIEHKANIVYNAFKTDRSALVPSRCIFSFSAACIHDRHCQRTSLCGY